MSFLIVGHQYIFMIDSHKLEKTICHFETKHKITFYD